MQRIFEKLGGHLGHLDEEKIRDIVEFADNYYVGAEEDKSSSIELLEILLPLRPDEDTVAALLLHRLYIFGKLSDDEIKNSFGQKVLDILRNVKSLEGLNYIENDRASKVEVLRMMFLAMAKDIRVILVELACRVYKMSHLSEMVLADKDRVNFAKETMNLYVPIAARLGVYGLKSDLEDLSFKYTNPKDYNNIVDQLEKLKKSCNLSITFVKKQIEKFLKTKSVSAEVYGRIKNVFSIYRKLQKKGLVHVSDIYDVFAMRVILPAKNDERGHESVDQLYTVLGLFHGEWKPLSKKFKDYVAVPRPNGYRSLHTVVLGLAPKKADQPVEIQIRDSHMHDEAEYGIAAHWIYKESPKGNDSGGIRYQSEWIRGLDKIRSDFDLDQDIVRDVELDVFSDRIFILTPRGEVKELPSGSIPIDFAYSVHTDIGNRCVMAKVNGSIVPLDYELSNGDVVEIITKKEASPKLQWLSIVKTGFSKQKIKAWFSSVGKDKFVKEGRRGLNIQLEKIGKPLLDQNYSILKNYLGKKLSLTQRETLVEEVGKGVKGAWEVIRRVYPDSKHIFNKPKDGGRKRFVKKPLVDNLSIEEKVLVGGESGLSVKIAACCVPKFGDNIIGYVTRNKSVSVHKTSCFKLESLNNEKIIFATWKKFGEVTPVGDLVRIKIWGVSRIGLLSDVTSVISKAGVVIRDVSISKIKGGLSEESFLVEVDDLDKVEYICEELRAVKDVVKAFKDIEK